MMGGICTPPGKGRAATVAPCSHRGGMLACGRSRQCLNRPHISVARNPNVDFFAALPRAKLRLQKRGGMSIVCSAWPVRAAWLEKGDDDDYNKDSVPEKPENAKEDSAVTVDAIALAGTVASSAAIAAIGVAEVPAALLALPVALPVVALMAYRGRVSKKLQQRDIEISRTNDLKKEVNRILKESVNDVLGSPLPALKNNFADLETKISGLEGSILAANGIAHNSAKRLDESQRKVLESTDQIAAASVGKFSDQVSQLIVDTWPDRDLLLSSVREVVEQELATEQRMLRGIEVSLSDIKQDLNRMEQIQTRLIDGAISTVARQVIESEDSLFDRLLEASQTKQQSLPAGNSELDYYGNVPTEVLMGRGKEWLRDELTTLEDSVIASMQNIVEKNNEESLQLVENRCESIIKQLQSDADEARKSISELQSAVYDIPLATPPSNSAGSDQVIETMGRELRDIAQSLSSLQEDMSATEEVKDLIADLKSKVEQMSESTNVFNGDNSQVEGRIDDLAVESVRSFEGITDRLEDLTAQLNDLKEVTRNSPKETSKGTETNTGGVEFDKWVSGESESSSAITESPAPEPPLSSAGGNGKGEEASGSQEVKATEQEDEVSTVPVNSDDLLQQGLTFLRQGRKESQSRESLSNAEASFRQALQCFRAASQIDPSSAAAHGNQGNTLLAYSRLKMKLMDTLSATSDPRSWQGGDSESILDELSKETSGLLIEAGRCFREVLALNSKDAKALLNWGNALCLRARMTVGQDVDSAHNLYDAAIEKFEAVLQLEPGMAEVLKALGMALYDISGLEGGRERIETLKSAQAYLEDACSISPDDQALLYTLNQCQADLGRRV